MKKGLLFLFVPISLLIIVGLRRNSAPFFFAKEYRCAQNELISDDYFSSINTALVNLLADNLSARVVIDRLKKQFPVLNTITMSYRPSAIHVMMSVYEPVCCINNAVVLADNNELFPKDVFSARAVDAIAEVTVLRDSMTDVPLFVSSLLQGLPSGAHSGYNLELINEHCVRFVDKNQPNFTIVSSITQEKSPILLAQCESVKKTINERGGFNKGVKWIADTRFAHYIVAYKA